MERVDGWKIFELQIETTSSFTAKVGIWYLLYNFVQELFMEYLVTEGFTRARRDKRKTVYYRDLGRNFAVDGQSHVVVSKKEIILCLTFSNYVFFFFLNIYIRDSL